MGGTVVQLLHHPYASLHFWRERERRFRLLRQSRLYRFYFRRAYALSMPDRPQALPTVTTVTTPPLHFRRAVSAVSHLNPMPASYARPYSMGCVFVQMAYYTTFFTSDNGAYRETCVILPVNAHILGVVVAAFSLPTLSALSALTFGMAAAYRSRSWARARSARIAL